MKNSLLISVSCILSMQMMAQASGNAVTAAVQTNDAPVNLCSGNATTFSANGSAANATYNWSNNSQNVNFTTQTRQYYNPYTGKYEDTPNQGGSQAQAALPYDNSVVFDADVMINMEASSYTAIFSVTDFGKTVIAADSAMSSRLKIFTDGLKKDSIAATDIHIDFISMLPVYEVEAQNKVFSNLATEVPAGFKIKKNVHVLFYDHTKLDQKIGRAHV